MYNILSLFCIYIYSLQLAKLSFKSSEWFLVSCPYYLLELVQPLLLTMSMVCHSVLTRRSATLGEISSISIHRF